MKLATAIFKLSGAKSFLLSPVRNTYGDARIARRAVLHSLASASHQSGGGLSRAVLIDNPMGGAELMRPAKAVELVANRDRLVLAALHAGMMGIRQYA